MTKIGIAVIGLGRIGLSHIDAIQKNSNTCRLAAVVDANENLAVSVGRKYGVPHATTVADVLKDDSVQAVVVCLPHQAHAPVTIQAAGHGRHVLVEKVMATTLTDAAAMVNAAQANDVKLMVGQSRRFIAPIRTAKARIGEIGKIMGVLYNFACFFDIDSAPAWWRSKEATGGLVYPMLGSHSIDFGLWICSDREPISVYASGSSNNPDFEGDDTATVVVNFDDGTNATSYLTINNRPSRHECLIVGTEGSIYFTHASDHEGMIGVPSTDLFLNGHSIPETPSDPHCFTAQMAEFARAIQEGRAPEASGAEILTQMKILHAAQISSDEGRVITII